MSSGGVFDRLMRASVDRAQGMQPKRTRRAVDELLYASPTARDEVAAIRAAGARLVEIGILLPSLGSIAIRRGEDRATITMPDADLASIDNRSLETVELSDRRTPALAGIRAGGAASIHAFPTHVMALCDAGLEWDPTISDLADVAGALRVVTDVDDVRTGLTVVLGRGAVSTHEDPMAAAARLEAAESLARMTIIKRNMRREDG